MPIAIIAGVVVVAIAAVGFITTRDTSTPDEPSVIAKTVPVNSGAEPESETATEESELSLSPDAEPTDLPTSEVATTQFVDGTYTVQTSYFTPRRTEHMMDVSLTIENDVVVATEIEWDGDVTPKTPNHTAFENAYEAEVIGQPLSAISLSRVGGASLTSGAFNEAVEAIEVEAAA